MKMKALAGLITALFIASMLSTAHAPDGFTVDLVAEESLDFGSVYVSNDATNLFVTYTIDTFAAPDWYLKEVHIDVDWDNIGTSDEFPVNKGLNPKVGRFQYEWEFDPSDPLTAVTTSGVLVIPLGASPGTLIYIAAHACLEHWEYVDLVWTWTSPYSYTAWGFSLTDGVLAIPFGGSNWAKYFEYTTVIPP